MKDHKNSSDIAWQMFCESGNPAHYVLYKRLKDGDIENIEE